MPEGVPRPRLLLVDDDEQLLRVFRRVFDRELEITAVTSGAAALEALGTRAFDAAVVDFQMPGMNGAELVRRMAAAHPDLPVLMLTAYAALQEVMDLEEAALVRQVLLKPWEAADVRHALAVALGSARPGPEDAA